MRFFFPRNSSSDGFTLIEVLVALAIIITVVFAPISIVSQYVSENALTERHVQAGFLAQEIIEFVRCSRDTSLLKVSGSDFNWFSHLYSGNAGIVRSSLDADCFGIDYSVCTAEFGDSYDTYCSVTIGSDGYVSGVGSRSLARGSTDQTCDGNAPVAGHGFTATLDITVPQQDITPVRYAVVESCVSWSDSNNSVERVGLRETIFEWVVRN